MSADASGSEALRLRPATLDDLDEIWAIEAAVFGAEAWSREMMREELGADHRVYLALVGGDERVLGSAENAEQRVLGSAEKAEQRVLGSAKNAEQRVLGYAGLLAVGAEGDIQTIALDPGIRGRGQGRRLMNALLDAAEERGVREVFLEVRADNPVAQSLYASLGFEEIGVRPKYYQPEGVDAVVMKLDMRRHAARHRRISTAAPRDAATRRLAQHDERADGT